MAGDKVEIRLDGHGGGVLKAARREHSIFVSPPNDPGGAAQTRMTRLLGAEVTLKLNVTEVHEDSLLLELEGDLGHGADD